ncbi:MAG TPA: VanW family protein [Candidatus Saccharimonadales bacterium]|nr:VanW family protein [Candidatus Saccharimonadales bacterium]
MAVVTGKGEAASVRAIRGRRIAFKAVLVPLLAMLALLSTVFAIEWRYADRALPGLLVAGIESGSLTAPELRARLETELGRPWAAATVTASYEGTTWRTTNGELGIAPDLDAAVEAALTYGKQGALPERATAWLAARNGDARVAFTMRATGSSADQWVGRIARDLDRPARDAALAVTYTGVQVTEAVIGRELDTRATVAALLAPQSLSARDLALSVKLHYPATDAAGSADAQARARAATTPLRVAAGDGSVSEDAAGLATLLNIEKIPAAAGDLPAVPKDATTPATRYRYVVTLNEDRTRSWIAAVANELDRPAKSASYRVNPDGTLAVIPSANGVKIDQDKLLREVSTALFTPVTGRREVAATFVTDLPVFTTEQAAKYAAGMVRISGFTTSYPANASRHANITTGSLQFDNLVVAPGQTFSFWDNLGPVTVERGYAYAGAIINNRSDESVIGGGLCQVSTTLFNAVARAGYDIVERSEHGYYIDRYPLGFDAAVFLPGSDFRWRNDTAFPVLIRAYPAATSIGFELFSIPTGRTVVLGDAVETNLTMPAKDQPADPAYPPGAIVQGRDVSRSWTVYENGRMIRSQVFRSHYVPVWGGPAR